MNETNYSKTESVSKEENHCSATDRILKGTTNFAVVHPSFLVLILWFLTLVVSTLKVVVEIPTSYFSNKKNFFNQFFVKQSWGWTLGITGTYMIITSFVHGCDLWKKALICSLSRLGIGSIIWYFWTNFVFQFVENLTGVCTDRKGIPNFDVEEKLECIKLGNIWDGFDMSGHCFLLTYIILFVNSELQIQKCWYKIPTHSAQHIAIGTKTLNNLKRRYQLTLSWVKLLFFVNCVMSLLACVMLISTCLYFHSFFSKALGASSAIFSWMVTYNEWYKCKHSPGLPGDTTLQALFYNHAKRD